MFSYIGTIYLGQIISGVRVKNALTTIHCAIGTLAGRQRRVEPVKAVRVSVVRLKDARELSGTQFI